MTGAASGPSGDAAGPAAPDGVVGPPDGAGPPEGAGDPATTCARCGTSVAQRPLTWSLQVGAAGEQWLCATCTRDNVRAIEGRLDDAWW